MVKCLPTMCTAMSSIPSTTRMGKGRGRNLAGPYFPSICEALGSMPSTAEREGKGMSGGAWDLE